MLLCSFCEAQAADYIIECKHLFFENKIICSTCYDFFFGIKLKIQSKERYQSICYICKKSTNESYVDFIPNGTSDTEYDYISYCVPCFIKECPEQIILLKLGIHI